MEYNFTKASIAEALDHSSALLRESGMDSRSIIRLNYSIEETLMKYLPLTGEDSVFDLRSEKKPGSINIRISIPGASYNPIAAFNLKDSIDSAMSKMLRRIGVRPTWNYFKGSNELIFSVSTKKRSFSNPLLISITVIAVLALVLHLAITTK